LGATFAIFFLAGITGLAGPDIQPVKIKGLHFRPGFLGPFDNPVGQDAAISLFAWASQQDDHFFILIFLVQVFTSDLI
jgi:hypothetical protein